MFICCLLYAYEIKEQHTWSAILYEIFGDDTTETNFSLFNISDSILMTNFACLSFFCVDMKQDIRARKIIYYTVKIYLNLLSFRMRVFVGCSKLCTYVTRTIYSVNEFIQDVSNVERTFPSGFDWFSLSDVIYYDIIITV